MSGLGKRVREAREKLGLSQAALARQVGMKQTGIMSIEAGDVLRPRKLLELADTLGVTQEYLLYGDEEPDIQPVWVPLVGKVQAGSEMKLYSEAQGPFEKVLAPDGSTDSTVAVEIEGDSLGSFFDKWLVFYDDVRRPMAPELLNRLCVVGLPDGRVLVKKVRRGSRGGLYTLVGQFGDPIMDTPIEWAARVKNMVPK